MISEPPCSRDSTTITTSASAAIDAIAHREPVGLGRRARWRLRQQQTLLGDGAPQITVLARVHDVVTRGDDRDRTPATFALQRAAVCAAIDAPGQTGDDVHVGVGQMATERRRCIATGCSRVASADDRRPTPVEQPEIALGEHDRRRQRVVEQQRRIALCAVHENPDAELACSAAHVSSSNAGSSGPLPRGADVAVVEDALDQPARSLLADRDRVRLAGGVVPQQRPEPVNRHVWKRSEGSRVRLGGRSQRCEAVESRLGEGSALMRPARASILAA